MGNSTEIAANKPKTKNRFLKIIGKLVLGLMLFIILILLFIRSPWGQGIIVDKAVSYISNKTNTKVAVEKLFITFGGAIQLDALYLEDTKGDTLIFSKTLRANVPLWAIITGKGIGVDALKWQGVRANIIRKDSVTGYNFQFLIDALAPTDSTTVKTDTTAAPLHLVLGKLNFKNFDVVFKDAVAGIDSRFKIGNLVADMEKTDLENMVFKSSELELSNSNIKFTQKPVPENPDTEPSILPTLTVENLKLINIYTDYLSVADHIAATLDIKDLHTEIPHIDLANHVFEVDAFHLKHSTIVLRTETDTKAVTENAQKTPNALKKETSGFEWPNLTVAVGSIDLQYNNFSYFVGNNRAEKGSFNPNALVLKDLHLLAENINLKDKTATTRFNNVAFKEISGLNLKKMSLDFKATDRILKINNLQTALNNNQLKGNLQLNYASIATFVQAPETAKVKLNIPSFRVALQDVFLIRPELKKNKYLDTLSKKPLRGNLNADGYLSNIDIKTLKANWGNSTQIAMRGHVKNATQVDSIKFNVPDFSAVTKKSDVIQFVNEKELGLNLPEDIELKGQLKGSPNEVSTKSTLATTQGIAHVNGHFKSGKTIEFDADLNIENYKLDVLLQNPKLGTLNLDAKATAKGKNINTLDAYLEAHVSSFNYNNYNINRLKLVGDIKDGRGKITSKYKDSNLNTNFYAFVVLDSVAPKASIKWDITGADLQALGLMQRPVKTGMEIYADFKGNASKYDVAALIDKGVVVYNNKTYLMGDINAVAHVQQDTTSITFNNKLLNIDLQSNANPNTFSSALRRHVESYFYRDTKVPDSLTHPVNLKLRGNINQAPILKDVFFVNTKNLDTVNIAVDFNEKTRHLKANITAPHINYSGLKLDSLVFAMHTDMDKFNFNFGFKNIEAGPFNIPKTNITGNQTNNELALNFSAAHKEEQMMHVDATITGNRNELKLHVVPEKLILDKKDWAIPENNNVVLTKNKLAFNNFKINNNGQSVEITDNLPGTSKNHIAIRYQNFDISEVLDYFNPELELAKGVLEGELVIKEPFSNTGVVANLELSKFNLMDVNMGTLTFNAKSLGANGYDFQADIKGGEVDLDFNGDYTARKTGADFDANLSINQFNMKALNGFSQGKITETSGSFSGNFKLNGKTSAPQYKGQLNFNDANFKLATLNAAFTLKNESLKIDNSGLNMGDFTIRDQNQNTFTLSGDIGTKSFINPTFNLRAKADNFQFIDATKEDNDFLYGKASFDADAKITGDLQIPKIDINLSVGSNTDVTYVLPSATVNLEERDGVVVFVNRENPNAILTQTKEQTATVSGFDVKALLQVKKDAAVTLVLDQETGDNFKVSGEGDFNFTMIPNGTMTLAGVYEVQNGHYEMSLYNLVNRKFNLVSGSRVTWSGDPFDAKLDIKALYRVETSASSLMAPVFSGDDIAAKGKFRQVLPFNVYLNIDGRLMAPKIAFNLDMPEDEQGAIGGQVYGRVQQLNQQEDELNRQVFSLLVLNRFYPDPGSDGSTGGVASIARDNLNAAVSDQLNIFSDKLLGKAGFELDFGLDSYTDYQGTTPQERTQLDIAAQKKLFNDRLIVRVGSEVDIQGSSSTGEETPLIGNVSIEYLITENGRYRIKGFRRNEFENVIDGQTIVSGIALIFTQEFNTFKQLWRAMLTSQTKKEEQAEAEAKKAEEAQEAMEKATNKSIEEKKN